MSQQVRMSQTERHPHGAFIPGHARILMLGSFPPKKERWSMEFFYPNFNNDMWRIIGTVFFDDRDHFIRAGEKRFDKERIVHFCTEKGIALYDTATEVRRLKDNASDKFLEIVSPTDILSMLEAMPECTAVAATGQKAMDAVAANLGCPVPKTGEFTEASIPAPASSGTGMERKIHVWRMPSSSRAYPLSLEAKADFYRRMFEAELSLGSGK